MTLQSALQRLPKRGLERRAVEAGEIDAVVDHAGSSVILLPAARRALQDEATNDASLANSVLAALPRRDYLALQDGLEAVRLTYGTVLYEPGEPIEHVFFPIDCLVSLLMTVESRRAMEVGMVGREGMVGVSLALGVNVASARALVQGTGSALRMKATRFLQAFERSAPLRREVYRYTDAKLAMARQTVACNRFHTVEARLARWLLMTSDRVPSGELLLTQAFLGDMLGVLRAAVNVAAGSLQQRKLIGYRRGTIRILDRDGLEAASCPCYAKIASVPDGAAGGIAPRRAPKAEGPPATCVRQRTYRFARAR